MNLFIFSDIYKLKIYKDKIDYEQEVINLQIYEDLMSFQMIYSLYSLKQQGLWKIQIKFVIQLIQKLQLPFTEFRIHRTLPLVATDQSKLKADLLPYGRQCIKLEADNKMQPYVPKSKM